jgi:hypothetical protein
MKRYVYINLKLDVTPEQCLVRARPYLSQFFSGTGVSRQSGTPVVHARECSPVIKIEVI